MKLVPRILAILAAGLTALACTSSQAWIVKKDKSGGVIGYSPIGPMTLEEEVRPDFESKAREVCGKRGYEVRETLLPPPSGISGGVLGGDAAQKVKAGAEIAISDHQRRKSILHRKAPARYKASALFKSWNEAKIKCN